MITEPLKKGLLVIHDDSNGIYRIDNENVLGKESDEWVEGLTYVSTETKKTYWTSLKRMRDSFTVFALKDRMKSFRDKIYVGAEVMSQILGLGQNQWRLYEQGDEPNKSNRNLVEAILNHPETFLDLARLAHSNGEISKKAMKKIEKFYTDLLDQQL